MTPPRGHIKIARKVFDPVDGDVWWNEKRTFSRWEAWVDLIQLAQWRGRTMRTKYGIVTLHRGEFVASMRTLGKRWRWSKNKVSLFLKEAENLDRITGQQKTHAGTVYLIVKYDEYQRTDRDEGTAHGTDNGTNAGQTRDKNKQLSSTAFKSGVSADAENPPASDESPEPPPAEKPAVPAPTRGGWIGEATEMWRTEIGAIEPGHLGRYLKPAVESHGWPAVQKALHEYAWQTDGQKRSPKYFADDVVRWLRECQEPLVDPVTGWLTPKGERLTRPAVA